MKKTYKRETRMRWIKFLRPVTDVKIDKLKNKTSGLSNYHVKDHNIK